MDLFPLNTGTAGPPPATPPAATATTGLVMGYYDGNTVTALVELCPEIRHERQLLRHELRTFHARRHQPDLGSDQRSHPESSTEPAMWWTGNGGHDFDQRRRPGRRCVFDLHRQTVQLAGNNIGDLLNPADVTWGFFQGGFDLSRQKSQRHHGMHSQHDLGHHRYHQADYIPHHQPFQYYASTANPDPCPSQFSERQSEGKAMRPTINTISRTSSTR